MSAPGNAPVWPWEAPLQGRLKASAEDFRVEELPATLPDGTGEHLWLEIEKRGLNTEDVAVWIARSAGVGRGAVSYAGRKDRHAVTRQWFSVACAPEVDPGSWTVPEPGEAIAADAWLRICRHDRHARKLRTGHLAGNRFTLRLRELEGDGDIAEQVLERIRAGGVPAYFGEQRFGHANRERAYAWLGGGRRPRGRNQRSLLLSAARAELFNAVLAARVRRGDWDRILPGERINLDGSGSVFTADTVDAELEARAARLDVHPTGPLWGRGDPGTGGEVRELEDAVAAQHEVLVRGLEAEGLKAARRALRLVPRSMEWEWETSRVLRLQLELGPGEYATSVAEALMRTSAGD